MFFRESESTEKQTSPFRISDFYCSSAVQVDECVPDWNFGLSAAFDFARFSNLGLTKRRLVWIGLALAALGVLVLTEEEEDGPAVLAAPLLLGLAIEVAVFLLRNSQSRLLLPPRA